MHKFRFVHLFETMDRACSHREPVKNQDGTQGRGGVSRKSSWYCYEKELSLFWKSNAVKVIVAVDKVGNHQRCGVYELGKRSRGGGSSGTRRGDVGRNGA